MKSFYALCLHDLKTRQNTYMPSRHKNINPDMKVEFLCVTPETRVEYIVN